MDFSSGFLGCESDSDKEKKNYDKEIFGVRYCAREGLYTAPASR